MKEGMREIEEGEKATRKNVTDLNESQKLFRNFCRQIFTITGIEFKDIYYIESTGSTLATQKCIYNNKHL